MKEELRSQVGSLNNPPAILHCRQILYLQSHQGSPSISNSREHLWTLTWRATYWRLCYWSPEVEVTFAAKSAAKSLQLCLTLCDPMDCSPPGFSIHDIRQARTLEWVAISFSNAWKWKEKVKPLSRVQLPATPWTAAYQAPPSMGFSGQQYWSGVPLPSPEVTFRKL